MRCILLKRDRQTHWWADVITTEDLAFLHAKRESLWQPEFEILAVLVSLHIWSDILQYHSVTIHGDALAALYAADKSSSKSPAMNFLAGEIGLLCEMRSMTLQCKHVPESINIEADSLSRLSEGKSVPRSLDDAVQVPAPVRDSSFYLQPR